MTHVRISTKGHKFKLEVDGVDFTQHVLRDGFKITPSAEDDLTSVVEVHMVIAATEFDGDFPGAVIKALAEDRDQANSQ